MNTARPGHSTCPRCGTTFVCGSAAGEAECWCVKLPAIAPPDPGNAFCLCPACLAREIETRNSAGG